MLERVLPMLLVLMILVLVLPDLCCSRGFWGFGLKTGVCMGILLDGKVLGLSVLVPVPWVSEFELLVSLGAAVVPRELCSLGILCSAACDSRRLSLLRYYSSCHCWKHRC